MKRKIVWLLSFFLVSWNAYGQLTLQACRQKAHDNYPLVRQYDLIQKTGEYNVSNASKAYLPQFSLSVKATYQSDVTELPIAIPGINISPMRKDQYQIMAELKQNIWDGGESGVRKQLAQASTNVEKERLNVDMYALDERIDQLYFGILLLDEQLKQNTLLKDDLEQTLRKMSSDLANGIAGTSDVDAVKVEQLNVRQKEIDLIASKEAYMRMLSLFIGQSIDKESVFEKPFQENEVILDTQILRPELVAFNAQRYQLGVQEKALSVRYRPQIGLFVQGAYGNPGLNMLKDKFTPFYIGGVRLSWNFGSLYTLKNDKRLIDTSRQLIDTNQDLFLFNTQLKMAEQNNGIAAIRKQMADDDEIIRLRTNIRKTAEVKVENGTMTVTDMLHEMTAERLACQTKVLHEVQLLMKIYQLKHTINH